MIFGDDRLPGRFWAKVTPGDGCWLWTGATWSKGYGNIMGPDGKLVGAHGWACEVEHGPRPDGAMALHSCDVPGCVNPAHLRWGTHLDNMSDRAERGRTNAGIRNAEKTHCPRGHEYTPENTGNNAGARTCRTCRAAQQRERRKAVAA